MGAIIDEDTILKFAHKHSRFHRKIIDSSATCGCFNCSGVFTPDKIKRWTDEGQTATCPYCDIDSVVSDGFWFPITKSFLRAMHNRWFRQGSNGNGERVVI